MPIYLDNAATSFPKPESVYVAIDEAHRHRAVAARRGRYQRAEDVNRLLVRARNAIAKTIGAPGGDDISFAFSGTDALSTAIMGYLNAGDHVVASAADHTSVLRPLWHLQEERNVEVEIVECDSNGFVDAANVAAALKPNTKMVCLTHASNVTGAVQPVEAIGKLCRDHGVTFLLDAAQTVGHHSINIREIQCDFLAAPGHKGLLGPFGTGFLYASPQVASQCLPLRFGGTGSDGNEFRQPTTAPGKFESGNLNLAGIAGLLSGIQWLQGKPAQIALAKMAGKCEALRQGLSGIAGVVVHGPNPIESATVSFNIQGVDCQTVGMILDSQFQIECRTGLHCAPLIHQRIGSQTFGGTVRMSPGVFNTREDIEAAVEAVAKIAAEMGEVS